GGSLASSHAARDRGAHDPAVGVEDRDTLALEGDDRHDRRPRLARRRPLAGAFGVAGGAGRRACGDGGGGARREGPRGRAAETRGPAAPERAAPSRNAMSCVPSDWSAGLYRGNLTRLRRWGQLANGAAVPANLDADYAFIAFKKV